MLHTNIMNEEEHNQVITELEKKYLNKYFYDADSNEFIQITAIYVDYRRNAQNMTRVEDEWGNITFISELGKIYDKPN